MIQSEISDEHMAASRHHAVAIGVLLLLAIAQTWPLVLHLGTHLPGTHAGDNVIAVWLGVRALETGRTRSAIAAGLALGLTAWADYYLFAYAATILAIIAVSQNATTRITVERRASRWPGRVFLVALVMTFLGAVAI